MSRSFSDVDTILDTLPEDLLNGVQSQRKTANRGCAVGGCFFVCLLIGSLGVSVLLIVAVLHWLLTGQPLLG